MLLSPSEFLYIYNYWKRKKKPFKAGFYLYWQSQILAIWGEYKLSQSCWRMVKKTQGLIKLGTIQPKEMLNGSSFQSCETSQTSTRVEQLLSEKQGMKKSREEILHDITTQSIMHSMRIYKNMEAKNQGKENWELSGRSMPHPPHVYFICILPEAPQCKGWARRLGDWECFPALTSDYS